MELGGLDNTTHGKVRTYAILIEIAETRLENVQTAENCFIFGSHIADSGSPNWVLRYKFDYDNFYYHD